MGQVCGSVVLSNHEKTKQEYRTYNDNVLVGDRSANNDLDPLYSSSTIQTDRCIHPIDAQCHGASQRPSLSIGPHNDDQSGESNYSDEEEDDTKNKDEELYFRLLTNRDHSTDMTLVDPIAREVSRSLEYWNTRIAPRTNTELAEKVNVRLVPILQYLEQSIERNRQLSSSPSTGLPMLTTSLPQLLGISTASQMFRWLCNCGAALMIVRSASAAAGIYAQLTINRLSQLTHVSCREISAIEKVQGRVRESANVHLCKIARYIMSEHHPWIQEPSSLVLENVIKHRMGLVLSHQMYNVEHEKRHIDVIRQVLEGLTLHDGQCISEFIHVAPSRSTSSSPASNIPIPSLLALEPFTWAREVPVVVHHHQNDCRRILYHTPSLFVTSSSLSSSSEPISCDDDSMCEVSAKSSVLVSSSSSHQQQQRRQHYPQVATSKGVSADIVIRLSEDLWVVIEAKFLSDKSNVHNKTPRMLEAKRQCEAHKDPSWRIVYIAFMGGDWEVSQLRHLQQEGFKFVWEHSPHQLGDIIIEAYKQHCRQQATSDRIDLSVLSDRLQSIRHQNSDVDEDAFVDDNAPTMTPKTTHDNIQRKKRKRVEDGDDDFTYSTEGENDATQRCRRLRPTNISKPRPHPHLQQRDKNVYRLTRSKTKNNNDIVCHVGPTTKRTKR